VRRVTCGRKCLLDKRICISTVAGRVDDLRARFPHDCVSAHFTRAVRNHVRGFRDRWIFAGSVGFAWPSRSPDFFILEPL
jgi:hypothetical protein